MALAPSPVPPVLLSFKVDLPQRSLGDDGAWVLKQALLRNRSVTSLCVPNNLIRCKRTRALKKRKKEEEIG